MAPFSASRHRYVCGNSRCGCRRDNLDFGEQLWCVLRCRAWQDWGQSSTAVLAELGRRVIFSAALRTSNRQRAPAVGAELPTGFTFRAAFCAAHIRRLLPAQLIEQGFGVLQIGSVEALREPVVNLPERCAPFIATSLARE